MQRLLPILILTATVMTGSIAHAQSSTAAPDTSASGTKPENRGVSGWTGGAREPNKPETTGSSATQERADPAADQPWMASGSDLKGPAQRFPADKTPE